tara:strand:- start:2287 stop:3306 length:1020 start_codon:yes stop_codon:yes gene_type:complete
MEKISKIYKKIMSGNELSTLEAFDIFDAIFKDKLSLQETSAVLTILSFRGETYKEILGVSKVLINRSKKISLGKNLIDTCGTGGDNKSSFNISTATAILLAACGLNVSKHGNRSVTSKSGSIDVLEALGIKILNKNNEIKMFFKKNKICFLFAPFFHESLKKLSETRVKLKFRTIFNLLGPLLNPSKPTFQLIGVSEKKFLKTHALCLKEMDIKEGWVVTSSNGFDELTTSSTNLIMKVKNRKVSKVISLNPEELGLNKSKEVQLKGGDAKENAFLMHRLFEGETGSIRDNVILNTAACLTISGKVKSLKEGLIVARKNIDNFNAKQKLEKLISDSKTL